MSNIGAKPIVFTLVAVQTVYPIAEVVEHYKHVTDLSLTLFVKYEMPALPHGHESTYGSTRVIEPWPIAYVTSAPVISSMFRSTF